MSDPKLIEDLVRAGTAPELVGRVANALLVEAVTTHHDASRQPSRSKEAERAARYRNKLKQDKANAGANDAAQRHDPERDGRHDASRSAPLLSSFLSLNSEGLSEEGSKSSKKVRSENARARGQRMITGAILTDEWLQAAIDLGAAPSQVPEMWAEHVDYWIGVPGARGVKLDWLATWRNDVRRKLKMGNRNGTAKQSLSDRARDLAEQARSAERARGLI